MERKAYRILKDITLRRFGEEYHWIIGNGGDSIRKDAIMLFDRGFKNGLNFICINVSEGGNQTQVINPEFSETDIMNLIKVDALEEI